ncbi:tetratricopeptide repeat-containing sensor histidine kinase [Winogradskyella tangerina]|uniref:tetratricopeptide repeat-containing sensor histidine kinase n=1 Tax=Winogradskyella tangerina TaxID=2023240 RepID=UPI000DBE3BE1|nr:tetratricopeptide repeat-containing sensor histidine kinase [Winogradskyella tangerina]
MKVFSYVFISLLFIFYSVQSETFAQNSSDSLKHYSKLALNPQSGKDLSDAYRYFDHHFQVDRETKDKHKAVNSYYYLVSILYKSGNYHKCEEVAVKALKILDKMRNSTFTSSTRKSFYNLLGVIYKEQKNYSKAEELFLETLNFANTPEDSAKIYNNTSQLYLSMSQFKKAKDEILKAYKILPRVTNILDRALIIDNYGVLESETNKANALILLKEALKLRESVGDTSVIYTSYSHLAQYHFKIGKLNQSKVYALKAYQFAEVINSPIYRSDALSLLTKLSDDKYVQAYKRLSDSLNDAEKYAENKFALAKYDVSKVNNDLLKSKRKQRGVLYVSLLLLATFLIIYFFQNSRHKKEKLQQVYDTETRISKKVHDDIANDIFQVMMTLQAENSIKKTIKKDIERIYDKARDISKLSGEIDLDFDYTSVLKDLALSFNNENTSVIIKDISKINWDKVPKPKKLALFKILQELLINMKKHSDASVAVISFSKKLKKMVITYSDDGVGCNLKMGIGLLNVENRINAMGGHITFNSIINNGFKVKIEI